MSEMGIKKRTREGKMKKIFLIAFVVFFCASVALGDEVDTGLSSMATEQIKVSTRQMIRSGINSDDALKMTRLMLENRFREEHALRAHQIITDAHKEGLSVEPIMSKAYEGIAKQVKDRNIVEAMEKVRYRYSFAYKQANELTPDKSRIRLVGNTIAEGLAAGMNDDDVGRVIYRLQHREQQMTNAQVGDLAGETFRFARDMARLGVSSRSTADVVCQALQHRYGAKEMTRLRKSFMKHSRNYSPTTLSERYLDAIRRGRSVENLEFLDRSGEGGRSWGPGPGGSGGSGSGYGGGSGSGVGGHGGSSGGRGGKR
jgi:hypothetical protein